MHTCSKCPTGSHKMDDECIPIKRCANGYHRKCVPVSEINTNVERLMTRVNENELLKDVISDYENLYSTLKKQKKEQQEQLNNILRHLKHIQEDTFLSNSGLKHIEHEQNQLLDTLKKIQHSVHKISEE